MSTIIETIELSSKIRVALIVEAGKIKPVWFEEADKPVRDRVFIKEVCNIGHYQEGAAKIITFDIRDGCNSYRLLLNTREFTWRGYVSESRPFP